MAALAQLALRVAARHLAADAYFEVGEEVLYGKFKNRRGRVVRIFDDERGVPSVEIEPIPKGRRQNRMVGLYGIWKLPEARKTAAMDREACIIAGRKFGDGLCLMKTRDRAYDPKLQVLHVERDGTEMAVVFDKTTGYLEGVNEHGIGIVNTTLMVVRDEQEGVKKTKGDKQKGPKRSKDGPKIFKALEAETLDDAIRSLVSFRGGIKGHTFVADGERMVCIERSGRHPAKIHRLDPTRVNTRTNHGVAYPDAGYTHGDDYVSSIVRRWEAQKRLQNVNNPEVVAPALVQAIHEADSPFNPVRCTDKMRTTSQLTIDTTNPTLYLYVIPGHADLSPPRNVLPDGRRPKIPVRTFRYRQRMEDRTEQPGRKTAREVLARYKSKKKVRSEDGDETTVYEYSERQVQHRNREKAERIERLRGSIGKLRAQLEKDIRSDDPKKRDVAAAVGLMDHTYERPGNDESASDGHYGVTNWKVRHVRFGDGQAKISYVGKSGVRQQKSVTDRDLVKALRAACADKGAEATCLDVSADEVNEYLRPFGVTAKDLRGLHANGEMKDRLRRVRREGGPLPEDPEKREEKLRKEFDRALDEAAETVGHEPSTLKSQYLVPGLEEDYKRDGTVSESHAKKAAEAVTDTASFYVIAPEALRGMLDDTDWLELAHDLWPGEGRPGGDAEVLVPEMERQVRESGGAVLDTGWDGGFDVGVRGKYDELGRIEPFDLPVREKGAVPPYGLRKSASLLRVAAEEGTSAERRILANALVAPVLVARTREWWLREAPHLYRIARDHEKPRPRIEGLEFPSNLFTILWYEDADGNDLGDGDLEGEPGAPEGAQYQHSQFPHVLHHNVLRLNDDGTSTDLGGGEASYPEDLVNAMVRSGDWDVGDAIMVAAQSCERCLNVLCHHYDLDDGYPFGSEEYWSAGTRCPMCENVHAPARTAATPNYEAYVERKRREGEPPLDRERWERRVLGVRDEEGPRDWDAHRRDVMRRHELDKLHAPYDPENKHLRIDLISVRRDARGEGHARRAMEEILGWADRAGATVTLTPTSEFGASKKRLTRWYEGMGFVPNKGRNKDFRFQDAMIRAPQVKTATKSDAELDEEAVEEMLREEPKKKPPRYDLRDNRPLEDDDEEDLEGLGGGDRGDRDLSLKWNKVGRRVAFRWLATPGRLSAVRTAMRHRAKVTPDSEFQKEIADKKFRHPETGNEVAFGSLPTEEQHRIFEEWKKKHAPKGEPAEGKEKPKEEPEGRSPEEIDQDISEAREAAKKLKGEIRDLKEKIGDAKKAIEDWTELTKGEVGEEMRKKGDAVIKEMKRIVLDAEDDIEYKTQDLKDARRRVQELKEEREDPTGAKAKKEQEEREQKEKRTRQAVKDTVAAMEKMLGRGSRLPQGTRQEIESALGDFDYPQLEAFALAFQGELKDLSGQDPTSPDVISMANRQAKIGFDVEGVTDPEELARRAAEVGYVTNVVANPMVVGGRPVGQTEMDDAARSARAREAFAQFENLHPKLQRMAAERIREELRGLDEDTDRAVELESILSAVDLAHVGQTGEALPGRPQPSAGNAALIKRMIADGNADRMFQTKKDFFSEGSREAMAQALEEMDDADVANFITGDDPSHPFYELSQSMRTEGAGEFNQMIKDFLIKDFLNDTWGDRAARDVMEAAGVEDWDSPEARAELLEESKRAGETPLGQVLEAKERVEAARAAGEEPSQDDLDLVSSYFEPEAGEGVVGNARALLGLLRDKFKKHVISPAVAVLNHFVKTRDPKVLSQETLPHPDERSPEPRPKEEREKARVEMPTEAEAPESKPGKPEVVAPEWAAEGRKPAEDLTPEKAMRRRIVLKSERQKLEAQREKAPPEERGKYDVKIRKLDKELERASVPKRPEKKAPEPEKKAPEPEKVKEPEVVRKRRKQLEKVKSVRDEARAALKEMEPAARKQLEQKLEKMDAAIRQVEEQHAEDEKHGPGDVWKTKGGNWRAKNEEGLSRSFKKRDEAETYARGEPEKEWSAEFKAVSPEEAWRGPTRFAGNVTDAWLARIRSIHPDDPDRPVIVLDAA